MSANENCDDYFGLCPHCHQTDGYYNAGRNHWFFCREHKTKWWAGSNLFSSWRDETEEEQRKQYDVNAFGSYERVEPYQDPSGNPALPAPADRPEFDGEIPF